MGETTRGNANAEPGCWHLKEVTASMQEEKYRKFFLQPHLRSCPHITTNVVTMYAPLEGPRRRYVCRPRKAFLLPGSAHRSQTDPLVHIFL